MINTNEEIYEKQIINELWFTYSNLASIQEIIKNLPNLQYLINEEKELEKYCTEKVFKHVLSKKVLTESMNCKSLCRNGVPCKYMKDFLLKLFNIDISSSSEYIFEAKRDIVLKTHKVDNLEDYVPYFSGYLTMNETLPVNYLNSEGILQLKTLLWMINSVLSHIEFSPLISKLTMVLLVFCKPFEVYFILKKLIDDNYAKSETFTIRWHFRFNYVDNNKIITSLIDSLNDISLKSGKDTIAHFDKINFPVEKLYEDMIYGFFLEYLNFEGISRLLPIFLMEGIKSMYRLAYAILKTIKADLLVCNNPDQIISIARTKSKLIVDLNKLFTTAFTYKLNRTNNKYDEQKAPEKDIYANKRNSFYLPNVEGESAILSFGHLSKLWAKLPVNLKIKDLKLIYSGDVNGYSLSNIFGLNKTFEEGSILFLMCTANNEIFGGIISEMIKLTNLKSIRPLQSLLISIEPSFQIYEPKKGSDNILYCDTDSIMFGIGPNGPALRIDKDLNLGDSHENNAFNLAPCLVQEGNEFKVKKFEIFLFK